MRHVTREACERSRRRRRGGNGAEEATGTLTHVEQRSSHHMSSACRRTDGWKGQSAQVEPAEAAWATTHGRTERREAVCATEDGMFWPHVCVFSESCGVGATAGAGGQSVSRADATGRGQGQPPPIEWPCGRSIDPGGWYDGASADGRLLGETSRVVWRLPPATQTRAPTVRRQEERRRRLEAPTRGATTAILL